MTTHVIHLKQKNYYKPIMTTFSLYVFITAKVDTHWLCRSSKSAPIMFI